MRRLIFACVSLAVLAGSLGSWAQTPEQSAAIERKVKAAYLYKFASYVEWPPTVFARADSPLVVGVIGADALADELENTVAGRTANGRSVTTRKLRRGDPMAGLHVLFIGHLEKSSLLELFATTKGQPILTVTESEDAHALGSMIHFVIAENRLRFEVALKAVALGQLKISALMLAAAYKVTPASL